jgi:predicted nucleic acid-binding protein
MLQGFEIIISDTSCLILLGKINGLHLLDSFNAPVFITPTIKEEFGGELPDWVKIKSPKDFRLCQVLEVDLDSGEASAIALAMESNLPLLIIDELKGRKMAENLMLPYTGTLGLMLKAKQLGKIQSVKPYVEAIRTTNFRISEKLLSRLLTEAGEM